MPYYRAPGRRVTRRERRRFFEVPPLEQERLTSDLGEGIGETVAEIQPGRVTALAEVVEGLARDMYLLDRERLDDDPRPAKKHVALADGLGTNLTFDNYRESRKLAALIRQRSAS